MTTNVLEQLRLIQKLCQDIAMRLETDGPAYTIPRNFEYEGRCDALREAAGEIGKTIDEVQRATSAQELRERLQSLMSVLEHRKKYSRGEKEKNYDYRSNLSLSNLYYLPMGAEIGYDKALELLRESFKASVAAHTGST
jgi:hypothetical protein